MAVTIPEPYQHGHRVPDDAIVERACELISQGMPQYKSWRQARAEVAELEVCEVCGGVDPKAPA